jgi:hypothetical protein
MPFNTTLCWILASTFTQHALEILTMLFVAFGLGILMGFQIWGSLKRQLARKTVLIDHLNTEMDVQADLLKELKRKLEVQIMDDQGGDLIGREEIPPTETADMEHLEIQEAHGPEQTVNEAADPLSSASSVPEPPTREDVPVTATDTTTESDPETSVPESASWPLVSVEPAAELSGMGFGSDALHEPAFEIDNPVATAAPPALEADDLTVIEGIGEKIQELLMQYGIHTYHQLSTADVDQLKFILETAGVNLALHHPGTWPSQANLAANHQWDSLKAIQGFLKSGKTPD